MSPTHSDIVSGRSFQKNALTILDQPEHVSKSSGVMPDMEESFDDVDLETSCTSSPPIDDGPCWNNPDNITALGLSFGPDDSAIDTGSVDERFAMEDSDSEPVSAIRTLQPFDKWVKLLHKNAESRRQIPSGNTGINGLELESLGVKTKIPTACHHKKSSSTSSLGFVTAIKSASISLASFSIAPRPRRQGQTSKQRQTDRSSRTSIAGPRLSEDSCYLVAIVSSPALDEAVLARSVRRRQALEEIINTEESYIGDVRFLMNVYVTLLASIPTISLRLRSSINRNLTDIIELHEELLGGLHRVVPHSEYSQMDHRKSSPATSGHQQLHSMNSVPENTCEASRLQSIPGMTSDPSVAADVARVFGQQIHRFFIYEEYGAKYEMMIKDIASTYRTLSQWEVYQKGLEALASSLASINSQHEHSKKSMTVGDLLVKPIQRICRYPLLFSELLKQTPVFDCPESYAEIEKVLVRLRETTAEINRATDDPRVRSSMEKSWRLQDRLSFPEHINCRARPLLRSLGYVHLCGVLHVAWKTKGGVKSQYMIALLYKESLLFAEAAKLGQVYTIMAFIALRDMRVEEVDNGKGLQCHTAPHSWKLVFECDHQLYEMILTACSPKEELEWKRHLSLCNYEKQTNSFEQGHMTSLTLPIKPMGTVFGKPGTIARRLSIQRATTVGPKSSLCQVIIKNTSAVKDMSSSTAATNINRSQSLLTTNRIPVLAPSRAERIRLENLLSDVWTRDVLPFPGITARARSDNIVRSSASSVMRKLSVASIASNFSRRSGSLVSMASFHRGIEDGPESQLPKGPYNAAHEGITHETHNINGALDMKTHLFSVEDETFLLDVKPSTRKDISRNDSPSGTLKRLATLRVQRVTSEGHRTITPPLRTSSANSVCLKRTVPGVEPPTTLEGSENNNPQSAPRWTKSVTTGLGFSTQGFKAFFR